MRYEHDDMSLAEMRRWEALTLAAKFGEGLTPDEVVKLAKVFENYLAGTGRVVKLAEATNG